MNASRPSHELPDDHGYAVLERRLRKRPDTWIARSPDDALSEFMAMHARVDADVHSVKRTLFAPSLASGEEDRSASRWISAQHRRLGRVARRMAEAFVRVSGPGDHALRMVALGLHYMGESVKGHMKEFHLHDGLHALMRIALTSGRHHEALHLDVGGRSAACTLTSLYFRALVLARFAGGGLTFAQIEIVDAWMWLWMPALEGVDHPPEGVAWRADLDSNDGLRCGPGDGVGPSLYLARAPLEAVRLAIIKEFHAGRTVAAPGDVAKFSNGDHFAALDAIRRALRGVRHESLGRGTRYESNEVVELYVGLAEVMAQALAEKGRSLTPLTLMPMPGDAAAPGWREREGESTQVRVMSRLVQLIDVSDTGMAIEGDESHCGEIAVDDLVALWPGPGEPLLLARVVRRLPAATGGRVVMGLLRLSSAAQHVRATQSVADGQTADLSMLFIPGADDSGRNDAYLTSEEVADESKTFETTAGENIFTFRFNRVRERGRGWVMAGFEIASMRLAPPRPADKGRFDRRMRV